MIEQHKQLSGVFTALVTPMNKDGSIDFKALEALVDWQIEQGIDGLVPCGTTGESATLTAAQRAEVISRVIKQTNERVTVIAGAGANSTATAIEHQKNAKDAGAKFSLVVTPYYNKPTPEGLYRHYASLTEAVDLPIVLYNVPGRTGCDMKPSTVTRLANLERIVAIKEATADLDRVAAIRESAPANFAILSGDDGTACPFCWLGGNGVISVASNLVPHLMKEMIHSALGNKIEQARKVHNSLRPLFEALFLEANPIPIKAALALQGRIQEYYRLPLCEMSVELRNKLEKILKLGGWI